MNLSAQDTAGKSNAEVIEELTLRNQEVLIANDRLRETVSTQAQRIKSFEERNGMIMMILGSALFFFGLISGVYLRSRFTSSRKW